MLLLWFMLLWFMLWLMLWIMSLLLLLLSVTSSGELQSLLLGQGEAVSHGPPRRVVTRDAWSPATHGILCMNETTSPASQLHTYVII